MDIESLFAYEFHFEAAWAKILEAGGITVNIDFVDQKKKTPFVDSVVYLAEPTGTRINYRDQKLWHVWRGVLTTRFVTSRGQNSDQLQIMVGRARIEGQRFDKNFNQGSRLPHHFVNDMVESTPGRGHFTEQKFDWIELRHLVTLNIKPSSFV